VKSNHAFKPAAGEVFRTNQPLRAGGGLTLRQAASARSPLLVALVKSSRTLLSPQLKSRTSMSNERPDIPAPEHEGDDEPAASVIGISGILGVLLRFLRKFQLPAVALGKYNLYRIMIQGSGFELPVEAADANEHNPNGFYTTRFVAARSRLEAEALAKTHVLREWQGLSLLGHFSGTNEPQMTVCGSEAIEGWFRLTKGGGFTLYFEGASEGSGNAA
jgi:hypothetical protein